ncbi:MAG: type II toxin-antitoxin system HicA family toxin [Syntrophobacteraceae bacterium]
MKRQTFIRELIRAGCFMKRHGGGHDIYMNPKPGKRSPIPRHSELRDSLCELTRKQLSIGDE